MSRFGFGFGFGSQLIERGALMGTYRNFTTSTSGGSESWPLDSSVSLTGAFSITDDVATTSTAAGVLYSGGTAAGKLEVSLTAAGLVQVDVAGVTIFTGVVAVNDGKLNTLVLSRTGTTASLTVNGVSDGSGTMSGTVAFDTLDARTAGSVFFIGTHANIVVVDAGTEIHSWPIDEADPSTITDRTGSNDSTAVNFTSADSEEFTKVGDDWFGAELVTNGTNITTTTGWAEARSVSTLSAVGGNIRTTSDDTSTFGTSTPITTAIGQTYRAFETVARGDLSGTIIARTSPLATLVSFYVGVTFNNPTDGLASLDFTPTSTTSHIGAIGTGHGSGEYFELGDISVKRILEAP